MQLLGFQRGHNAEPRVVEVQVSELSLHTLGDLCDMALWKCQPTSQTSHHPGRTCPFSICPSTLQLSPAGNRALSQQSVHFCCVAAWPGRRGLPPCLTVVSFPHTVTSLQRTCLTPCFCVFVFLTVSHCVTVFHSAPLCSYLFLFVSLCVSLCLSLFTLVALCPSQCHPVCFRVYLRMFLNEFPCFLSVSQRFWLFFSRLHFVSLCATLLYFVSLCSL